MSADRGGEGDDAKDISIVVTSEDGLKTEVARYGAPLPSGSSPASNHGSECLMELPPAPWFVGPGEEGAGVGGARPDSPTDEELDGFPYVSAYKDFLREKDRTIFFLPAQPITCKITNYEHVSGFLDTVIYCIDLHHAGHRWCVRRSHKDFRDLHDSMAFYRALLRMPLPITRIREDSQQVAEGNENTATCHFPRRPDALVADDKRDRRIIQLENYLQSLVKVSVFRDHPNTLKFLGVSRFSFVREIGPKGLEGLVNKRFGGYTKENCCTSCFTRVRWGERWLIVKDSCLLLVAPKENRLRDVLFMDSGFEVKHREGNKEIEFENLSRKLYIRCASSDMAAAWARAVNEKVDTSAKDFIQPKRFGSFAPIRQDSKALWFVDGYWYFRCVADALEQAREEIFITDWWLSPEIYMKRPAGTDGNYWRLDKILHRKADQGVKVYVLLYKEFSPAVHLDSLHSKQVLTQDHPNITVLRHPDHTIGPNGTFLWSHHEKIVCIDQVTCFLGGLDLCYGRWDDHQHRLTDLGSLIDAVKGREQEQNGGGLATAAAGPKLISTDVSVDAGAPPTEFDEAAIVGSINLGRATCQAVERGEEISSSDRLRLKLKVVAAFTALHKKVSSRQNLASRDDDAAEVATTVSSSLVAEDGADTHPESHVARNRWQKVAQDVQALRPAGSADEQDGGGAGKKKVKAKRRGSDGKGDGWSDVRRTLVRRKRNAKDYKDSSPQDWQMIDNFLMRPRTRVEDDKSSGLQGLSKLWMGKDYANYLVRAHTDLDQPFSDIVDRTAVARIPWHDIAGLVQGPPARDLARHFIQRWNFTKREKALQDHKYPILIPKTQEEFVMPTLKLPPGVNLLNCDTQVLRSVGSWSAGQQVETSIHEGYLFAIETAKHYIYIENQFFVSQLGGDTVKNEIAAALFKRIRRAHHNNEKFRVYMVIPLLSLPMECTMWLYRSLVAEKTSLLKRLALEIPDPHRYISIASLRVWDTLRGSLVSEMIYVHSKLMIVDDNMVIYGSANLNDRSLLGRRDSELAVCIQDREKRESSMAGEKAMIGPFASSLRKQLFTEFLGLSEDDPTDLSDPVCDEFFNMWVGRATTNAEIYEEVFNKIPTNRITNPKQLDAYLAAKPMAETDPDTASAKLKHVKGYLSRFPLDFLKELESWSPQAGTKGSMVPDIIWT